MFVRIVIPTKAQTLHLVIPTEAQRSGGTCIFYHYLSRQIT
jgi:hypothetical protein